MDTSHGVVNVGLSIRAFAEPAVKSKCTIQRSQDGIKLSIAMGCQEKSMKTFLNLREMYVPSVHVSRMKVKDSSRLTTTIRVVPARGLAENVFVPSFATSVILDWAWLKRAQKFYKTCYSTSKILPFEKYCVIVIP